MKTYYALLDIEAPIGTLTLTSDGTNLTGLHMQNSAHRPEIAADWIHDPEQAPIPETIRQLRAYFAGELEQFDLPMEMAGTHFQQTVWGELTKIPYGVTISYGELAKRVGNSKASRAVGLANGRNPIGIIVPCHRVIGSNGKLVGYGGGLNRKVWLLDRERRA